MMGALLGPSIGAGIGTAASQVNQQYNEYMRKLMDNAANSINPSIKFSPSHITMTLEEFQKIPVSSGDELLNVIKTMCRLQGVDMEDATSFNVKINIESATVVVSIQRKFKLSSMDEYNQTATGINLMQRYASQAAKAMAQKIDADIARIIAEGGNPQVIEVHNPMTMMYEYVVKDANKC